MVEEKVGDGEEKAQVSGKIIKKEERTLFWFFVVVGVVFALVLVPYFWTESGKVFEFGGIDWIVEDYDNLRIFHGRFVSLINPNLNYNIFFRTDPRLNDVSVSGKLDSFKYGGIISLSPEVDACRGDLSRVMLDLSSFLKQGVGVGPIEAGSNNEEAANENGRRFVTCDNVYDRTVVVVELSSKDDSGELGERGIIQDEENLNCYTIYAKDCEDSEVVEKFMVKAVEDFRDSYMKVE